MSTQRTPADRLETGAPELGGGIRREVGVGCIGRGAASLLCSVAGSLEQLVAFRALQGVGGGIINAAVFAALPSLFSPAARARMWGCSPGRTGWQAYLAHCWPRSECARFHSALGRRGSDAQGLRLADDVKTAD